MSQSVAAAGPDQTAPAVDRLVGWAAAALAAIVALTTVLGNGQVAAAVAPLLLVVLAGVIWVAPLRVSLGLAMFVGLAVDRPGDTDGYWASPLVTMGGLWFHNLNHVIPIDALKFSGVFALVGALLGVRVYRRLVGRVHDTPGSILMASPMSAALALAAVAVIVLVGFGAVRGGDVESAKVQVQAFLQLLGVAYLFGVSLRGTRDYRWLGSLIVAGACIKSVMALWVRATLPTMVPNRFGGLSELEYATNHGDSIVFACALAVLIGPLFHLPTRRQLTTLALAGPLILCGAIANDRRIVWVQIALVVAAFFAANPRAAVSRAMMRLTVLLSPLLAVYVAVGWTSSAAVFAPVSSVRNLVQPERSDGTIDRSTLFRDLENYNLVTTFRTNPVLGTGFGHPFVQAAETDALPDFTDYLFLPHNSMLGLWAFTGAAGFTGLTTTLVVGLLLAVRARLRAVTADEAIAAVAVVGCLLAYVIHLWADIGFTEAPTIFLVGLALAMAGQLAVVTGDWPEPRAGRQRARG